MIGLVWMLACTGGGTVSTGDDSGTTEPEPIYPNGDRILVYTGHDGEDGKNSGAGAVDDASEWIKATYGWNVSPRTDLAEPTQYRVMFLMDSGVKGESVYGTSSVDLIKEALAAGVRVVSMVSPDNCEAATLNQLFEDVGIASRYNGGKANTAMVSITPPFRAHQLTAEVTEARFLEACFVDPNGSTVVFADEGDAIVTAEQVGDGGDFVVMGSYSWLDDRGYLEQSDNQVLLGNMVEVDPSVGPLEPSDSGD